MLIIAQPVPSVAERFAGMVEYLQYLSVLLHSKQSSCAATFLNYCGVIRQVAILDESKNRHSVQNTGKVENAKQFNQGFRKRKAALQKQYRAEEKSAEFRLLIVIPAA